MDANTKNQVLNTLAQLLDQSREQILAANQRDLTICGELDPALLDRLKVDDAKIDAIVTAVEDVLAMADPEGRVLYRHQREDGLRIENRSVPFGTILIIYESRPDVTIEAAVTAFKAGNRILLKGGKEAAFSNSQLVDLWHWALADSGVDTGMVEYLQLDRQATRDLIRDNPHGVDLIIPRGGDSLIDFVRANTDVPVLVSGRGNNFMYIDSQADFSMATAIALDGKSRLSVCNALDKVLIHRDLPELAARVTALQAAFEAAGIEVFGDATVQAIAPEIAPMPEPGFWDEEFLAAKILFGLVDDVDQAIEMINRHSGGHSAVVVSEDRSRAEIFQQRVDCAAVYHNASTRFTDGGQFGRGAEIAISTQKLHARGPLGLAELVTNKWFIDGTGQVRG